MQSLVSNDQPSRRAKAPNGSPSSSLGYTNHKLGVKLRDIESCCRNISTLGIGRGFQASRCTRRRCRRHDVVLSVVRGRQAMASSEKLPGKTTRMLSSGVAAFGLTCSPSLCAMRTTDRHASFLATAQLTSPTAVVFFDAAIAKESTLASLLQVSRDLHSVVVAFRAACWGADEVKYEMRMKMDGSFVSDTLLDHRHKGPMPNVVASLYHDLTSGTINPPARTQNRNVWITLLMAIFVLVVVFFEAHQQFAPGSSAKVASPATPRPGPSECPSASRHRCGKPTMVLGAVACLVDLLSSSTPEWRH
ncbi:hypothetical protein D9619_011426 [Psilocybe cf. subviscida]|uniref:Uncharacterized protein n=1 Tax=Psilocybe cf. subviscida TaxID=2480587 RepID=A0A8H5F5B4_9AGAR|nr:hypothetical protein D9619_011426 [Psilocybe cf. subviscida]